MFRAPWKELKPPWKRGQEDDGCLTTADPSGASSIYTSHGRGLPAAPLRCSPSLSTLLLFLRAPPAQMCVCLCGAAVMTAGLHMLMVH